jgi:hypothetical protein
MRAVSILARYSHWGRCVIQPPHRRLSARTPVGELPVGVIVFLACGCSGKRWTRHGAAVSIAVARACDTHEPALDLGLDVEADALVRWYLPYHERRFLDVRPRIAIAEPEE